MQTSIAIGWIRAPQAYVKYNDFVTFFILIFFICIFSRNRVTAERSVAQTCMMAQTTRFDASTCLLGVSLMYACIKGSRIPKNPQNFGPYGNFKLKRICSITFERKEIDTRFNSPLIQKWGRGIEW
jgi:hypothetical protein